MWRWTWMVIGLLAVAGAACEKGVEQLANEGSFPGDIVVDDKYVYWIAYGIYRVPKGGGEVTRLSPARGTCDVATVDEDAIYCAGLTRDETAIDLYREVVGRSPKRGGPGVVLALEDGADVQPWNIVVDEEFVYAAIVPVLMSYDGETHEGKVIRVPKQGGDTTVLAAGMRTDVDMAIDDQWLYWVDKWTGDVSKVPKTGGPATVLASGIGGEFSAIVVHDDHVYVTWDPEWIDDYERDSVIWSVPIEGGLPEVVATGDSFWDLYADDQGLVWLDTAPDDGGVKQMTWDGEVTTLASHEVYPWKVTADDAWVYWTTLDGDVRRARR